jgi:hypothetical protein
MSKPSAQSVRSKQSKILRYIASSDLSITSSDLGLSTNTIRKFLAASPQTVQKHPEKFSRVLKVSPLEVAKERERRLVPKLSGERLKRALRNMNSSELVSKTGRVYKNDIGWTKRSVNYARATRLRYTTISPEGKVTHPLRYEVKESHKRHVFATRQILAGFAGENSRSMIVKFKTGAWSYDKTQAALRDLWNNSDVAFTMDRIMALGSNDLRTELPQFL